MFINIFIKPAADGGHNKRGFTVVELAIVLIVVAILLFAGATAWTEYASARRVILTTQKMRGAVDCLKQSVLQTRMYPGFSEDYSNQNGNAVDKCVGPLRDAWDQPVYYIQGVATGSTPLNEAQCFLVNETTSDTNDPCHPDNAPVRPDALSVITDDKGETVEGVVFVLVSFGKNGQPEHDSYGDLFSQSTGNMAAVLNTGAAPDFTDASATAADIDRYEDEDLYVVATFNQLAALLAETKQ